MAVFPIWKDNFANTNRKYFRISGGVDPATNTADGIVFYNGAFPTAGGGDIHLNTIVAPRLRYGFPDMDTKGFYAVCDPQTFKVETSSDGSTWVNMTRDFGPDWSYNPAYTSLLRNDPVNGHFSYEMTVFWSQWGTSPNSVTPRVLRSSWYNQTAISITGTGGTASFPIPSYGSNYNTIKQFQYTNSLGTITWDTLNACAPAALYYRNAYGGWDTFLIEGAYKKSVAFTRYTRKVTAYTDNAPYPWARGEQNYVTERVPRWTWSTKGLTDTESAKFVRHLLASPDACLHDFATGYIYPVIIETDATEVKTYQNNGRRISTYEVTCRLAEERIAQ